MIYLPTPKQGESRQSFVNRCIPYLIHEGKHPNTDDGRKAAAGECYGIYDNRKKSHAFIQVHFTDINEDEYKELKDNDKFLWDLLSMNYPSHIDVRVYNEETDELDQFRMKFYSDEDIEKAKKLFNKCESFWLEPKDNEDKYSYMALIWGDNVNERENG